MGCLMNRPKICPINLLWESGSLHRLSAILSFWPCWEWWLDPSQPAIDGLALDQDDWVALLLYARVYSSVCVGAWLCVLTLHACCSLRTTAHLWHSVSSLSFEFWVLSIIASAAAAAAAVLPLLCRLRGEGRHFFSKKYSWLRHQIIIKTQLNVIPSGNERSSWHRKSWCSAGWGGIRDGRWNRWQTFSHFVEQRAISMQMFVCGDDQNLNRIHARLHKNVIPSLPRKTVCAHK